MNQDYFEQCKSHEHYMTLTDIINMQYADIAGTHLHIWKDHDGIPQYTGTRAHQANRPHQHRPRQTKEMIGRTVLCNYDSQPTDQSRRRNNTSRSYYHRQGTTNRYPTQNEGNVNNDNHSDSESENQQKQQQLQMKYNNKIKLKTEIKNKKKQRIHSNNRKTLQLENIKLHQQHNTRLRKNHHQKLTITTRKFRK